MLNIEVALERMHTQIQPIQEVEEVPLIDASGRTLSANVVAPISLPPFTSSAMDGYAIRYSDLEASTRPFEVVGTSFAGHPYEGVLSKRCAIRIFTGAEVASSCDTVILQEDVDRVGDKITIKEEPSLGANVRPIGQDVSKGSQLLTQGTAISPFEIAWLAACGIETVEVKRRIRVAVFSTGDELQTPGQPLGPGQIYDSNRTALIELLKEKRVEIVDLGCLKDDPEVITQTLREASESVDLVITSGGVSVGDADYVKPAVESLGRLAFWNVALKPGKPIAFAQLGSSLFFGLPGNPVSTIVTYLLFVAPAIDRLAGKPATQPLGIQARLSQPIAHKPDRREYQRGFLQGKEGELVVSVAADQSSNRLATFANCNCLIVVPEEVGDLEANCQVEVLLLPRQASHLLQEGN